MDSGFYKMEVLRKNWNKNGLISGSGLSEIKILKKIISGI